jgi:hypothetical protein
MAWKKSQKKEKRGRSSLIDIPAEGWFNLARAQEAECRAGSIPLGCELLGAGFYHDPEGDATPEAETPGILHPRQEQATLGEKQQQRSGRAKAPRGSAPSNRRGALIA